MKKLIIFLAIVAALAGFAYGGYEICKTGFSPFL